MKAERLGDLLLTKLSPLIEAYATRQARGQLKHSREAYDLRVHSRHGGTSMPSHAYIAGRGKLS
jgi:hypothetical protein